MQNFTPTSSQPQTAAGDGDGDGDGDGNGDGNGDGIGGASWQNIQAFWVVESLS